ncbi:MAG: hypothetical protein WCH11_00600, partial [Bdellovibrio sp.]
DQLGGKAWGGGRSRDRGAPTTAASPTPAAAQSSEPSNQTLLDAILTMQRHMDGRLDGLAGRISGVEREVSKLGALESKKSSVKSSRAQGQSANSEPAVSVAGGQVSSSAPSGFLARLPGKLSAGLQFSTASVLSADDISFQFAGGKRSGGLDLNTSAALALTAQYQQALPLPSPKWNMDWLAGITLEGARSFDSVSGSLASRLTDSPSIQPWVLNGGLAYRVNQQLSVPVSLNYTILNFSRAGLFKEFTVTPELGYQLGVLIEPNPRLAFEIMTKETRYRAYARGGEGLGSYSLDTGELRLNGLTLAGRYIF